MCKPEKKSTYTCVKMCKKCVKMCKNVLKCAVYFQGLCQKCATIFTEKSKRCLIDISCMYTPCSQTHKLSTFVTRQDQNQNFEKPLSL